MQPSRFPYRLQYVTPQGEEKWSEPVHCLHELQVLAYLLRDQGNTVQGGFHDDVGNPLIGPFPARGAPPCWVARLGVRVC